MTTFSASIDDFIAQAQERSVAVVRDVVLRMQTRLVERSPVDKGDFRGNWQVGAAGRPLGETELQDHGPLGTGPSSANRRAAEQAMEVFHMGNPVWLVNNRPYAVRLEYGYSLQAPSGVARLTVLEFRSMVDAAARGVNR